MDEQAQAAPSHSNISNMSVGNTPSNDHTINLTTMDLTTMDLNTAPTPVLYTSSVEPASSSASQGLFTNHKHLGCGFPSTGGGHDDSSTATQPADPVTFMTEEELANQKLYFDNYPHEKTPEVMRLAEKTTQALEQKQRERIHKTDPRLLTEQPAAVSLENNDNRVPGGGNGGGVMMHAQPLAPTNRYSLPAPWMFGTDFNMGTGNAVMQYEQNVYTGHQYAQPGQANGSTGPLEMAALASTSIPEEKVLKSGHFVNDFALLFRQAQARENATHQQRQAPIPDPSGDATRKRALRARLGVRAKPKPKNNVKSKPAAPTAMQRAPISVAADREGKRVKIQVDQDGLPQIILREGEDPNTPVTIAECVARARDEQLTGPPSLNNVNVSVNDNNNEDDNDEDKAAARPGAKRAARPPYLQLDDSMSTEEKMERAMQNQVISELDRQDRRARNNESARRTRERTRNTIAAQAATIQEQEAQIAGLRDEVSGLQQLLQQQQQQQAVVVGYGGDYGLDALAEYR